MVKMLKKLKKAMAAVKNNKNGSPSFIEVDSKLLASVQSLAKEYGLKSMNTLKNRILEATSVSTMPVANAFRILVTDIQKEKDMKASKCEEDLGNMEAKFKDSTAITKSLYPKISKWTAYLSKLLKPMLRKVTAEMKADNQRVISIQQLQSRRNKLFEEHQVMCRHKKDEYDEEIKNAHSMLEAISMIRKAVENPSMAVKYAVRDVEQSLRKQAALAEKKDEAEEYGYMPKLSAAIAAYKKGNKFFAPSDDEVEGGAFPNVLDKHGCKTSAGYTYCTFSGKCQRMWEEPCYYHPEVESNRRANQQ